MDKCPECSSTSLIRDGSVGEVICGECGLTTYLCIEPILPDTNPIEVVDATMDFVDVYDFGALNPHSIPIPFKHMFKVDERWQAEKLKELVELCRAKGLNYSIAVHSRKLCEKYDIPYKHLTMADL